jgi:hypothetical protein
MGDRDIDEVRVLGRRWVREIATPEERASALHAAEGDDASLAPSADPFLAANGCAGPHSPDVVRAFLDGVATSEGEE